jgi:ADP-heptose:LPS heptosyltransferase
MPARTYPWQLFAQVADGLVEKMGATVFLTGSSNERQLTARIAGHMQRGAVDCAGELSFPELCALIEASDLTVTNNTGPMHVAAAVKTPVVALFALTNPPEQWGPWRVPHRQLYHPVPCRLCYSRICPYGQECLTLVSPAEVVAACCQLLSGSSSVTLHSEPRPALYRREGDPLSADVVVERVRRVRRHDSVDRSAQPVCSSISEFLRNEAEP